MSKKIVICCDGTNAEYRENNTNVVKTVEAIERNGGQVVFYDPGVGTFSIFGRTIGRWFGIVLGMAFGYGIRKNIEDGYEYLMNKYEPDDRIYIFGFSRGAYTARALAGMVCKFGILHKDRVNLIPYVTKMHFNKMRFRTQKAKDKREEVIAGFRTLFCHQDCVPYFIGVWDTVGALGPNLSKRFHNNVLNENIKYGYHAISVDEKRWTYKVRCWDERNKQDEQTIEQVWFPGGHSDIGGGCRNDERELSDIAFAWMMDKANDCGLRLRPNWTGNLRQDYRAKMHNSWKVWLMYIVASIRRIPDGARVLWPIHWLYPAALKATPSASRTNDELEVQPRIHQSVIDRMQTDKDYHPVLPDGYITAVTASYPHKSKQKR